MCTTKEDQSKSTIRMGSGKKGNFESSYRLLSFRKVQKLELKLAMDPVKKPQIIL